MTFPKHIMTTAELARMGFPSKTLDAIAKEPEQNIAFRLRRKRLLGHRKIAEANRR